jgi:hypothetical protein
MNFIISFLIIIIVAKSFQINKNFFNKIILTNKLYSNNKYYNTNYDPKFIVIDIDYKKIKKITEYLNSNEIKFYFKSYEDLIFFKSNELSSYFTNENIISNLLILCNFIENKQNQKMIKFLKSNNILFYFIYDN